MTTNPPENHEPNDDRPTDGELQELVELLGEIAFLRDRLATIEQETEKLQEKFRQSE